MPVVGIEGLPGPRTEAKKKLIEKMMAKRQCQPNHTHVRSGALEKEMLAFMHMTGITNRLVGDRRRG